MITKDKTKIAKAKDDISRDIVLKFQTFTDKLNNRVAEEVENFMMNKNIENTDRTMKLNFLHTQK